MDDDNFIPTSRLALGDVPSPNASLHEIEEFCLTVDGYECGRFSIADLLSLAEQVEHKGLERASLEDLRSVAFIRQRELKWNDIGSVEITMPMERRIREIVTEIRTRLNDVQ